MAPRTSTASGRVTLAQSLYGFVAVSLLVLAMTSAVMLSGRSEAVINEALDRAVRVRAVAAAQMLARTIESDWRDLRYLSSRAAHDDPIQLRGVLDGLRGDGSRISWIGLATLDGKVTVATDGVLEGTDVGDRTWFTNGLRDAYASDVHETFPAARSLQSPTNAPLGFISLALPVRNGSGDVIGVVAMNINLAWAEAFLMSLSMDLHLDLFLIRADGSMIAATDASNLQPQAVQILRAAQAGSSISGRETWPDGKEYFSSLVADVTSGDLPSFGWRLVGRLDGDTFSPDLADLKGATMRIALCALALLLALSAVYVRLFIRPIETLASSAQRIAGGGQDHYPPELRATAESADISAALARLQMRAASRIRSELR